MESQTVQIIATIIMVIFLISIIISIYNLIRIEWVYQQRTKAIYSDEYDNLPTFNKMLYKYWYIWDVEKIKKLHSQQTQQTDSNKQTGVPK